MANISNRLKTLFNNYLTRLSEEKNNSYVHRNPYYGARPPMYQQQRLQFGSDDDFKGVIYFYEWSNINNVPKKFFTLAAFESFLNTSHIFMAGYQKEIIKNLETPYIVCKHDSKDLIIKNNYDALKSALGDVEENKEPYNVQVTRVPIQRPKMIEPEGRWDEMHPELGGCWGW